MAESIAIAPTLRGATSSPFAWVVNALLGRSKEAIPAEVAQAVEAVGTRVLRAADLDDLNALLEEVALDPIIIISCGQAVAKMDRRKLTEPAASEISDQAKDVLGLQAAGIIEQLIPLVSAMVTAVDLEALATADVDEIAAAQPQLFYRSDIPSRVQMAWLSGALASAASLALMHACKRGTRLEPWLAVALAKQFSEGFRSYLSLLYANPDAGPPPAGIEPMDLEQLVREHQAAEAEIDRQMAEAPEHD